MRLALKGASCRIWRALALGVGSSMIRQQKCRYGIGRHRTLREERSTDNPKHDKKSISQRPEVDMFCPLFKCTIRFLHWSVIEVSEKKEDTAAAKMVGEDVGEDRLHSVDLLLELMPHSYAVHSDWCKVIMVLAFCEVHFFYHCNPFLRSQEAEEAADAAGQKLHRRRQQKSLAPSAWKVERLEWWSFIITPSIMKARRQRAINRSITTLYRRRKAFFWAARKRRFWHDGGWTRYLMVGAPHRNSKSEPHQPRQPVLHETTAVCYSHFLCSVVLRDDSIICWLWLTCGKMIKLIRPSEAEEERLRAKVGILYYVFTSFWEHSRTGPGLKHWTTWKPWCQSEWGADAKEAQAFAAENRTCGSPKEGSNKEARCGGMISI